MENKMKFKRLGTVLLAVLAVACLASISCVSNGETGDDNDDANKPNFVQETCPGCVRDEQVTASGKVTGYRFYSYVKNIGGAGKIGMTIGVGSSSASQEFTVTAGTSYTFRASVTVQAKSTAQFTYQAKFPGTAGYTDTHPINGYDFTGGPSDLQLNPR